jgi:hypothetical protein
MTIRTKIQQALGLGSPFINVFPTPILAERAPTSADNQCPMGQLWYDTSVSPAVQYTYDDGAGWLQGGANPATTTTYGTVLLTDNNEPVATKVYADSLTFAGTPIADETTQGRVEIATNAEAVAGTANVVGVVSYAVTPSNLASVFAAPPAIGGTTPAAGSFTTIAASSNATITGTLGVTGATTLSSTLAAGNTTITGTASVSGAATLSSTAHIVGAATLDSTLAVTGAATLSSTLAAGNTTIIGTMSVSSTTTLAATTIVGNTNINATGAGTTTIGGNSAGAIGIVVGSGGNFTLTAGSATATMIIGSASQTGAITLGNSTAGQTINIGTGVNTDANTVNIATGASGANSDVNILTGVGTAGAATLKMANNTRVTTIELGNVAPAAARTTTIIAGAGAQNETLNIMSGAMTAGTHAVNILTGNSSGGTETFNLCSGTGAAAINIGTGATGVKTIAIGGTAANVVTISNTQTTGSFSVGDAMTSGTITLGGATGTGLITIGKATNATGQTISIASGTSNTGANLVNILNGTTPGADTTLNIMNGAASAGTQTVNILATGATRAGAVNIATGAAAHAVKLGSTTGTTIMQGIITQPQNPAFLAYLAATATNKTGNGTSYTIGTDALTEVFDRGANFNTNGTFTAPSTGIYDLRAQVTITGATIATTFVISIVATSRTFTKTFIKAAGSQDESVDISALVDMTATDTAHVTITVTGEAGDTDDILGAASAQTYFCGCLVA